MAEKNNNIKDKDTADKVRLELLSELGTIRTLFREILSRYQTNLEAEMVTCVNTLSLISEEDGNEILHDKKQLKILLQALKQLKIKPRKGRLKDIRRIDDVTNLLYAKLVEEK